MSIIRIEGDPPDRGRLHLDVRGRFAPGATDYWDANWLRVEASLAVGTWRAAVTTSLHADEFERFRQDVARLNKDLKGPAEFNSMEYWLSLRLVGDGVGHVTCEGELGDE